MIFKLMKRRSNYLFALCIILFLFVIIFVLTWKNKTIKCIPKHLHIYLQVEEQHERNNVDLKLEGLLTKLVKWNEQGEVKNRQEFGPVKLDTPILVVRVHRDLERVQYLIASLAQVKDIQTVLLVFSHSFYDDNINRLIRKIDFCMVLQIFYPNSVQLYQDTSPEAKDRRNETINMNISYIGRDAQLTESKHHWWWTANFVFDRLAWTENHEDMVVFIEEGSYLLPDFLFMLRLAKSSLAYVSDASVLAFGRSLANNLEYDKLIVEAWRPPYDKGLAFNRTTWRRISSLGSFYCQYDDTSWSYSLIHLFEQFSEGRAVMVASMAPRVIATGVFSSGRHALESICRIISWDRLFPGKVHAVMLFGHNGKLLRDFRLPLDGNGGWRDQRDRYVCLHHMASFSSTVSNISTTTPSDFILDITRKMH